MIKTETFEINGRSFTRTWSTTGCVMRDGVVYNEACDPTEFGRTYEEVPDPEDSEEVTPEDITSAFEGLL